MAIMSFSGVLFPLPWFNDSVRNINEIRVLSLERGQRQRWVAGGFYRWGRACPQYWGHAIETACGMLNQSARTKLSETLTT
jgi:hypothetical protein